MKKKQSFLSGKIFFLVYAWVQNFLCGCNSKIQDKKITRPLKLLYVGRFTEEKNIPFLLDVVAQLSMPYEFTLIGYGYAQCMLQQYAYKTLGLSRDRVRFIIRPPKQKIVQFYATSHVKLFASQTETQGLVLAEAMAAGTPVIALSGSGVNDIVQSGINGYLVHTKNEMVERIVQIMHDTRLYRTLSIGAYKTSQQYTQKNIGKKLEKIYNFM